MGSKHANYCNVDALNPKIIDISGNIVFELPYYLCRVHVCLYSEWRFKFRGQAGASHVAQTQNLRSPLSPKTL
jgi:hypothetical protein